MLRICWSSIAHFQWSMLSPKLAYLSFAHPHSMQSRVERSRSPYVLLLKAKAISMTFVRTDDSKQSGVTSKAMTCHIEID